MTPPHETPDSSVWKRPVNPMLMELTLARRDSCRCEFLIQNTRCCTEINVVLAPGHRELLVFLGTGSIQDTLRPASVAFHLHCFFFFALMVVVRGRLFPSVTCGGLYSLYVSFLFSLFLGPAPWSLQLWLITIFKVQRPTSALLAYSSLVRTYLLGLSAQAPLLLSLPIWGISSKSGLNPSSVGVLVYLGQVTLPSGPLPNFLFPKLGGDGLVMGGFVLNFVQPQLHIDKWLLHSPPRLVTLWPHWSVSHPPSPMAGRCGYWWLIERTCNELCGWISPAQVLCFEEKSLKMVYGTQRNCCYNFLFSVTNMYFAKHSCDYAMQNQHKGWWMVSNSSANVLKALMWLSFKGQEITA